MISEETKNRIRKQLPTHYVSDVKALLPCYSRAYIVEVKNGKRMNLEIWEALSIIAEETKIRLSKLESND